MDNSFRMLAYVITITALTLAFTLGFFIGRANAGVIEDAAFKAYHNRTPYYEQTLCPEFKDKNTVKAKQWAGGGYDNSYDCADHAIYAYCYLKSKGMKPGLAMCEVKGVMHMYTTINGIAINNTSSAPISVADVGCDESMDK